ncbi:MAG TPA: hypothetical protein VIJ52_06955 [Pseudolabrys sp.]
MSARDNSDVVGSLILLVVVLGIVGLIVGFILAALYFFVIYVLPFLLVGGALFWYVRHPYPARRDRHAALALRVPELDIPTSRDFVQHLAGQYFDRLKGDGLLPPSERLCEALLNTAGTLYEQEDFPARFELPPAPIFQWRLRPDYWPLERRLSELETTIDQFAGIKTEFADTCIQALILFTEALPPPALQTWDEFHGETDEPLHFLTVPACDMMKDVPGLVGNLASVFAASVVQPGGIFEQFIGTYNNAVEEVSAKLLSQTRLKQEEYVLPEQFEGTAAETVKAYLSRTPWYEPFTTPVPFTFDDIRFQHQWIVAPTGSGKTQLLKAQIAADLPKVARGEASIVVMDSQGTKPGTLVGDLIRLKLFAPGGPLEDQLVFLDPDPAHPLALNLFDFGLDKTEAMTERERRAYLTSAIDLAEFIINGLVGAEQTPMMKGISRYIIQALMVIPDATIETFRDLMAKGGYEKYRPYIAQLDDYTRDFFETRFSAQQYDATKAGVFWRIDTMMADPTFREMFLNPRNRLDLAKELDAGKVIVVNTDRELLKPDGTEAFGRFILAKLLLATQQRSADANPLPTYVYLDECQDYIHSEERIADLIDKARKQRVGFVFAHQRLANIRSANVADALANTAIQFAGGNKTDAAALANLIHTEPEFIERQPPLSFAAYVKGRTDRAIQVSVPYGVVDEMEKMTEEEEAQIRNVMRERYGAPMRGRRAPPPPAVDTPPPTKWD